MKKDYAFLLLVENDEKEKSLCVVPNESCCPLLASFCSYCSGFVRSTPQSHYDIPFLRNRRRTSRSSRDGNDTSPQEEETVDSLSARLFRLVMEDGMEQSELLKSRLPLLLNKTYIGPSTVAGRGLFASIDCSKGELLTCYPGDALVVTSDDDDWEIQWGSHVPVKDQIVDNFEQLSNNDILFGYVLFVSEDYGVLGLPSFDSNPAYLGHFANDGAATPTSQADLASYVLESNKRSNAMHQGACDCHMVTVATKNIHAGEEIFVTYGPDYWREHIGF